MRQARSLDPASMAAVTLRLVEVMYVRGMYAKGTNLGFGLPHSSGGPREPPESSAALPDQLHGQLHYAAAAGELPVIQE